MHSAVLNSQVQTCHCLGGRSAQAPAIWGQCGSFLSVSVPFQPVRETHGVLRAAEKSRESDIVIKVIL